MGSKLVVLFKIIHEALWDFSLSQWFSSFDECRNLKFQALNNHVRSMLTITGVLSVLFQDFIGSKPVGTLDDRMAWSLY